MKKQELQAKKEAEAPVTLGFMREFRAEIMSRFTEIDKQFVQVHARFDEVHAEIKQVHGKIDQATAEMKTMNLQTQILSEEQNLRNKQAYDGYALTYGAIQDLKNKIKPECLEE